MLATRRAPGAELRPDRERHLCRAARHERHLRRLVEELVEAYPDKVEVHQLDDGPHSRHRCTDAEAHDRRLRDRRVAYAVTELVVEAPQEPEDVAAPGHVDTSDEDAGVTLQLRLEGGVDRVRHTEGLVWLESSLLFGARPSRAHDEVSDRRRGRFGETSGCFDCVVELPGD